jgi:hypothetical protein
MYRDEIYRQIAREFSTGVGVATSIRVTDIKGDPRVERSAADRVRWRVTQDEWRVNRVICDAIAAGRYTDLARRVFWSRRTNPDWTERRHYTTAWTGLAVRAGKRRRGV